MDSVFDEPVFRCQSAPSASDDAGVWGEPALASVAAADAARAEHSAWLAEQWVSAGSGVRLGVFAGLCGISGAAAIACTLLKGACGFMVLAVVIGAPVVEEVCKAIAPLMVMEKRPWYFGSVSSIVLIGICSGFVFASVENLLYFFVYIPAESLTVRLVLWRLIACTFIHVACATISCTGLSRAWKRAADERSSFEFAPAVPWFISAIFLHGLYNLGVVVYELF